MRISFTDTQLLPSGNAQKLVSLRFSDNFDFRNNVSLTSAFSDSAGVSICTNLEHITNIGVGNGEWTCVQRVLQGCASLKEFDVSKIILASNANEIDLYYAFDGCESIEEIKGFNQFIKQKPVSGFAYTFRSCKALKELDFRGSNISLSRRPNLLTLFQDCQSLEHIYGLPLIFASGLQTGMSCMFRICFSLISNETETIDLSTIDMSNINISTNTNTGIYNLFYSSTTDMNNWEAANPGKRAFGNITHLGLPTYPEGMKNGNEWLRLRDLTTIVGCGDIHTPALDANNAATITFQNSPLTLDSAKLIMSKVKQATAGSTSTLNFSTYTRNLISNDSAALALVAQCQSLGWTVSGF